MRAQMGGVMINMTFLPGLNGSYSIAALWVTHNTACTTCTTGTGHAYLNIYAGVRQLP